MAVARTGEDFGSRLRAAREGKGVSLRDIANRTKISVRVLEALERNEITRLPGGIFSRAFVRAYAAEAGLDPDSVVDDFVRSFPDESVTAGHSPSAGTDEHESIESERRMASATLTLILVSLPVAGVLLYFGFSQRESSAAPSRAATPSAVTRQRSTPAAEAIAALPRTGGLRVDIVAVRHLDLSVTVDDRPPVDVQLSQGVTRTFEAERDLFVTFGDPTAFEWTINGLPGHGLGLGANSTVHLTPDNVSDYTGLR